VREVREGERGGPCESGESGESRRGCFREL
jgi:hypothetical protein